MRSFQRSFLATFVRVLVASAYALRLAAPAAPDESPTPVRLTFNHFYTYEELVEGVHQLVRAYPRFLSARSIGKSVEGREIWVVTVANPATGPELSKPAMYVDANIHGNEIQGGEVCLYTIQYLMENYERLARVKELVDERVFYVLPTVNPDGRAWWFKGPNTSGSSRSGKRPVDDDGDGLLDEDGFDDLDGDGEILGMWKPDPDGEFRRDPAEPRLLVRVKRGEKGELSFLGLEGVDNDGDGLLNEDGPGGYDMNRNWPADWQPQPLQGGAGDYPLSWPETRSVANFILEHPNIAGVQAYHNAGGMILRGPGDRDLGEYPGSDVQVYDVLGQTGEMILPFYKYMVLWRDLYAVHGGFINWTYEELGIFSFTNELWNTGQYRNLGREDLSGFSRESAESLKWDDLLELEHQFVELKPVRHPLHGDILVGGYRKTSGRLPPLFLLEELCHRNAVFTLYHANEMPRVAFRPAEVERLAPDTFSVTVTLENSRTIPSRSAIEQVRGIGEPDILELGGPSARVIASGELTDKALGIFQRVEREPGRLRLEEGVPGKGHVTYRFIVRGHGEITLRHTSRKAGARELKVTLP